MIYKKIIYVSMLCMSCLIQAQTVTEVFQQLGKQYSTNRPLQYKTNYALYKDLDSKKTEQNYTGSFYKNVLNEVYMKIGDTEILNSKKVFLKINHSEKAIEILDPIKNYFGDFDMKPLYDLCKIEKFIDYKTYWEITMVSKTYSNLPYSKIVVQISKDYFLQKQLFYYNTAINFSKDYKSPDAHYPRLEITYLNVNRNPIDASIFNSSTYFTESDKKQIVLAERLKKYEIIK